MYGENCTQGMNTNKLMVSNNFEVAKPYLHIVPPFGGLDTYQTQRQGYGWWGGRVIGDQDT